MIRAHHDPPARPSSNCYHQESFKQKTKKKKIFAHLGGVPAPAEVPNASPRVQISVTIIRVKSIRRDRLWSREEGFRASPPVPAEAVSGLITSPNTKFIFPRNVNQTISDQVSRSSKGGEVRGGEKFVNGRRFIRYSSYAVTRPCAQPIRGPLATSAAPSANQWRILEQRLAQEEANQREAYKRGICSGSL